MQHHIESLLENISSKQIEDLIDEHILVNESGYKFYYAIDNHDIVRYSSKKPRRMTQILSRILFPALVFFRSSTRPLFLVPL